MVKAGTKDEMTIAKLNILVSIEGIFKPFLSIYETDKHANIMDRLHEFRGTIMSYFIQLIQGLNFIFT